MTSSTRRTHSSCTTKSPLLSFQLHRCCACHEICTWRFTKCCACHEICTWRFTKRCACHEICTSSAGAQPTPGRTSDPLASSKVLCLPRDLRTEVHKVLRLPTKSAHEGSQSAAPATKSAHPAPAPSRRQGVHPTPWQAAKCCACHEICTRRFTKLLPAPATKSAHEGSQSAAPATKSAHQAPVPSRRQGVHPTPWQAAKCCACHEICTRRFTKYCACHEICT